MAFEIKWARVMPDILDRNSLTEIYLYLSTLMPPLESPYALCATDNRSFQNRAVRYGTIKLDDFISCIDSGNLFQISSEIGIFRPGEILCGSIDLCKCRQEK